MTSSPPIVSVMRAMHVLRTMNLRDVTSVNDLHVALDLPRPSIIRLLKTLEHIGYVTHAPERGKYVLTPKVRELSEGMSDGARKG
ncbi:helix-turn-helix domain-containing protein [Pseudooceanicola sp.]|jgi:IclR family mhp operon transcriptional activator|uniref:helix-turn-helix domain-containing protein n=1 Tax=Pseudooceanicola sp. TaxID=1914328 RepID=UPI0040584F8A